MGRAGKARATCPAGLGTIRSVEMQSCLRGERGVCRAHKGLKTHLEPLSPTQPLQPPWHAGVGFVGNPLDHYHSRNPRGTNPRGEGPVGNNEEYPKNWEKKKNNLVLALAWQGRASVRAGCWRNPKGPGSSRRSRGQRRGGGPRWPRTRRAAESYVQDQAAGGRTAAQIGEAPLTGGALQRGRGNTKKAVAVSRGGGDGTVKHSRIRVAFGNWKYAGGRQPRQKKGPNGRTASDRHTRRRGRLGARFQAPEKWPKGRFHASRESPRVPLPCFQSSASTLWGPKRESAKEPRGFRRGPGVPGVDCRSKSMWSEGLERFPPRVGLLQPPWGTKGSGRVGKGKTEKPRRIFSWSGDPSAWASGLEALY